MSEFTPTTDQVRKEYAFDASVEAAWDVLDDHGHNGFDCRPDNPLDVTAEAMIRAALPHIEKRLREQIAKAIEACLPEVGPQINVTPYRDGLWTAYTIAATIARTPKENPNVRP